jgi:hypothetical protein
MKTLFGLVVLALGLAFAGQAAAAPDPDCAPEGHVHYLCGMANVEDMVLAPGGRWIVASSMTGPNQPVGRLYLIDARKKTFAPLSPDVSHPAEAAFDRCPGPPDLSKLAPHGLGLRTESGGGTLYVVNHGGREAIEVFRLTSRAEGPSLRWIGCAILPDHGSGNGVAPLPHGGFVASKFQVAGDAKSFDKMAAGEVTGAVYEWRIGKGWRKLPKSEMSGANGVETAQGGRLVLVNEWPKGRVLRFQRSGDGAIRAAAAGFLPDNLRAAPDGSILVTGQAPDIKTLLACTKPHCPHAWAVARLDPRAMTLTPVLAEPGTEAFSDATVALQVGHEFWVGTYRGDRVAIVAAK